MDVDIPASAPAPHRKPLPVSGVPPPASQPTSRLPSRAPSQPDLQPASAKECSQRAHLVSAIPSEPPSLALSQLALKHNIPPSQSVSQVPANLSHTSSQVEPIRPLDFIPSNFSPLTQHESLSLPPDDDVEMWDAPVVDNNDADSEGSSNDDSDLWGTSDDEDGSEDKDEDKDMEDITRSSISNKNCLLS